MNDRDDKNGTNGEHEEALARLSRDLDGELGDVERILLAGHLDSCDRCAAVAARWRGIAGALRADSEARARIGPVGLKERILARTSEAASGAVEPVELSAASPAGGSGSTLRSLKLSLAAAAALLVAAGWFHAASGPTRAMAGEGSTLRSDDPALLRVLERWRKGRAAEPSFLELLLPGSGR